MNLLLIAKNNIKRRKSNVIILFILVAIATILLYTGMNVSSKMNQFFDQKNDSQNGAQFTLLSNTGYKEQIKKVLSKQSDFDSVEAEDCVYFSVATVQNMTRKDESADTSLIVYDMDHKRTISDLNIIDKGSVRKENSIVIPAYFKISKGYRTGDIIHIISQNKTYEYEIYGFTEDIMFSSPSNISVLKYFVPNDSFRALFDNDPSLMKQTTFNVRLKKGTDTKIYQDYVVKELPKSITDKEFNYSMVLNYDTMRVGIGFFVQLIMAVVIIFAILVLGISIIVIRFSIITSIENNMVNIGVLEALGYTSSQLTLATVLEFITVAIAGIFAGLLGAVGASNFIAGIISGSIGLFWKMKMDWLAASMSMVLILGVVLLVTLLTTKRFKGITPLAALRNGIHTHNFKKNYFPLAKSKLGLHSTLGIKEVCYSKKQNLAVGIIVALLTVICVLVTGLYYNFVVDPNALITLVGLEKPEISVYYQTTSAEVDKEECDHIFEEISQLPQVKETNTYSSSMVTLSKEKEIAVSISTYGDPEKLTVNTIVEGRKPAYDNEIVVTNVVLKDLEAKLGDVIYIETNGKKEDFLIVGVSQQISGLGLGAFMTEKGMLRLYPDFKPYSLYVYLKDGTDIQKLVDKWNETYQDTPIKVDNYEKYYNGILAGFTSALGMLCIVLVIITVLIVTLIIYMLIKMKLLKDGKQIGIYKALGYTTGQLIWQITMSFAPVISTGALFGAVLGKLLVNKIFVAMLSVCGIENSNLIITLPLIMGIFLSITILGYLVSIVCSMRIRTIEPYTMITE